MAAAVITGGEDSIMRIKVSNPTCPNCGTHASIPIVYGYPDPKQMEASMAGKIELGGCICFFDQPEWACRDCHHRWHYPCLVTSS